MEIDISNLHHAYLFEGALEEAESFLEALFVRMNVEKAQNPDLHYFRNSLFTIDEARTLTERVEKKAFGDKKIFVISTRGFTPQAQNALLKTFEEPTPNTHFFVLLPARDLLLPTLLSRLSIIRVGGAANAEEGADAFLSLPPKGRMDFIKKFVDKEKPLAPFLDSLLFTLRQAGKTEQIQKVFTVRRFADDQSRSPRLILEHLALVLK